MAYRTLLSRFSSRYLPGKSSKETSRRHSRNLGVKAFQKFTDLYDSILKSCELPLHILLGVSNDFFIGVSKFWRSYDLLLKHHRYWAIFLFLSSREFDDVKIVVPKFCVVIPNNKIRARIIKRIACGQ